jgi:hypothetical protein
MISNYPCVTQNIYTLRLPVHFHYPCISVRLPLTSPVNVSGGGEKRIFPVPSYKQFGLFLWLRVFALVFLFML